MGALADKVAAKVRRLPETRKCILRGGYTMPSGSGRIAGPAEVVLDQENARLHKHKLDAPPELEGEEREAFFAWLGVDHGRYTSAQEQTAAGVATALTIARAALGRLEQASAKAK